MRKASGFTDPHDCAVGWIGRLIVRHAAVSRPNGPTGLPRYDPPGRMTGEAGRVFSLSPWAGAACRVGLQGGCPAVPRGPARGPVPCREGGRNSHPICALRGTRFRHADLAPPAPDPLAGRLGRPLRSMPQRVNAAETWPLFSGSVTFQVGAASGSLPAMR